MLEAAYFLSYWSEIPSITKYMHIDSPVLKQIWVDNKLNRDNVDSKDMHLIRYGSCSRTLCFMMNKLVSEQHIVTRSGHA